MIKFSLDHSYVRPAVFAVLVHLLVIVVMTFNWPFSLQKPQAMPRHVNAVMLTADQVKAMTQSAPAKPQPDLQAEAEKRRQQELKKQQQIQQQKLAEQKRLDEQKKIQQQKDLAEQQRLAEQKKLQEQLKIAEKKKQEELKKAEEQKKLEQQKKEEAAKKLEAARKEKERLDAEKKAKAAQEQKLKDEARKAEERLAKEAAEAEKQLNQAYEREQAAAAQSKEVEDSEKAKYTELINRAITRQWIKPPRLEPGTKAELHIELLPTGELKSVSLVRGSGNTAFDRSALNAAAAVTKYPVPDDPKLFNEFFREFTLLFNPQDQ